MSSHPVPGTHYHPPKMIDPHYNFLETLTPTMQRVYLHHMRHWLWWLVETGKIEIAEGVTIHINERGFISAVGMDSLPIERLRLPPPIFFHGARADDVTIHINKRGFISPVGMDSLPVERLRLTPPIFFHGARRPSSVANLIMSTISNAPAMRYIVWKQVFETLSTAPPAAQTGPWLVELLRPAIQQEEAIWAYMEDLEEFMSIDSLRRLEPGQLAFRIRDLMGLEDISEDPIDTVSAACPYMAEEYLGPMMAILQYIANDGVESETTVQQRLAVGIFEDFWNGLMGNLRKGKLAYAMKEHLGLLEGTRRAGEPVAIDLT